MNLLIRQVIINRHDKWTQVTHSSTVSHEWISKAGVWKWMLLTHWGRVTHICISKLTIIGSDNGLSAKWRLFCLGLNVVKELYRPTCHLPLLMLSVYVMPSSVWQVVLSPPQTPHLSYSAELWRIRSQPTGCKEKNMEWCFVSCFLRNGNPGIYFRDIQNSR